MPDKCCLAVICIGENYMKQYNVLFRQSHELYAEKCGYDFKVITEHIDKNYIHADTICMQKQLICGLDWAKTYDFIICLDCDILINYKKAPMIHNYYNFGEKIGVVNQSQPTLQARLEGQKHKGLEITAREYYKLKSNHDIDTEHIINGGLMVWQPRVHKDFLQTVYDKYIKQQINHKSGYHYEQSIIGYEIQKNDMYYFMDMKWNALWANNKYYFNVMKQQNVTLQAFYDDNYFIHLAGRCDYNLIPIIKV